MCISITEDNAICIANVCRECDSDRHVAAMHPGPAPWSVEVPESKREQMMENTGEDTAEVTNKCIEICRDSSKPKSCSKICLVKVYPFNQCEKAKRIYAVLAEQSNRSLVKSEFFDLFNVQSVQSV